MELRACDGRVIAVEILGDHDATPVLLCHGLADSRLAAQSLEQAARDLGLRVIAPDRPGTGGTDRRWLRQLADWADDAAVVLDVLRIDSAVLLGVSGGGPFAAACAARLPARVRSLTLVSPLGLAEWPTAGMAQGERLSLALATRAPAFGAWSMARLAALARHSPAIFLWLAGTNQPDVDVRALRQPGLRESFLTCYVEAFRHGSWGVAQDLRLLTRPWGFDLASITVPTSIHHGDADTTVPVQHARLYAQAIPGARLRIHPGEGHFSILSQPHDILAALSE
jgi:pimeloyl-ACP methyl ester carboxylesterase